MDQILGWKVNAVKKLSVTKINYATQRKARDRGEFKLQTEQTSNPMGRLPP